MAKPYKIIIPNSLYIYTYKKCNVKERTKKETQNNNNKKQYICCASWHSISGVQSIKDIAQFSNGNENGISLIN